MKAIQYTQYGSPDVLKLVDVAIPQPQENQVLVKIHASSANPLDWHLMRGEPFLARLENGLRHPKNPFLGADLAGTVEAVGAGVTEFTVGDEVFGDAFTTGLGAFAEYTCVSASALAHKPKNLTFEQAAGVPLAALTALQGLRDRGQIQSGQRVLINGASGGVGTFAVQIAKAFDTEVTAVCSTRNLDLVRSIGADFAIDYTRTDFTRESKKYDLVFDMVGNRSVGDLRRALTPEGTCAIGGFTSLRRMFGHLIGGSLLTAISHQDIGMMNTARSNQGDLLFIRGLIEAAKIMPLIDRSYSLSEIPEAIRYLETSRARGKVIIKVQ